MGTRHWPPVTDRLKLATRYVHGELASPSDCGGSLLPELCLSTAFRYPSAEALQAVVSGEQTGDIYIPGSAAIRAFTPSNASWQIWRRPRPRVCSAPVWVPFPPRCCLSAGRVSCLGNLFGGTYDLLRSQLDQFGQRVRFIPAYSSDAMKTALEQQTGSLGWSRAPII